MATRKIKRKTKSKTLHECVEKLLPHSGPDECAPRRRSIPIAQVEQMIENEVRQVKASLTIYDDRLEVLQSLEKNEAHIEHLNSMLHQAKLNNKRIRSDLAQINLAIKRQLELDGE